MNDKMSVMKRMKRIFWPAILCGCVVFLTGCHGREGLAPFRMPEQFDTAREYEITFWAKNDTNKTQTAIYERAIEDFEKLYPNITVNMRLYTDYGKIYNDVITNIATDTTPNVCITYPDHIATYLTGDNLVVPLEEVYADEAYGLGGSEVRFHAPKAGEVIPQFLEECSFGGHCYALPYMRSTEACYINRTYVEALGYTLPDVLTWDYVWEVSGAAMAKDADGTFLVNGQKVMIPFIYKSTDNMMIQMLRQKDAGYSTTEGEIQLFNDTTAQLLQVIAAHGKSGAFSTFKISGYPANFLNAGQCIFAVDSTAGATWMGTDAPLCDISEDKIVEFETEVMMIPQFDPQSPRMISQGPSVCVFNKKDPQEVMAAWLFTQYLLTDEVQTAYAETEGYVPVTVSAQESEEYQTYLAECGSDDMHYEVKIKAANLLLDHVEDTFVTPVFAGSASLRDAAGQLVEHTVKSVRRGQAVDDKSVRAMYEDINALYRLDQIGSPNSRMPSERDRMGKLPALSAALLAVLAAVWGCMLLYIAGAAVKRKLADGRGTKH